MCAHIPVHLWWASVALFGEVASALLFEPGYFHISVFLLLPLPWRA